MTENVKVGTVIELHDPLSDEVLLRGRVIEIQLQWNHIMKEFVPIVDIQEVDQDGTPLDNDPIRGIEGRTLDNRMDDGKLRIVAPAF